MYKVEIKATTAEFLESAFCLEEYFHGFPTGGIKNQREFAILRNVDGKWKEGFRGFRESLEESIFDGKEKWFTGRVF